MVQMKENCKRTAEWIAQTKTLLIGSGAGMGVDSGLPDFRGKEGFWRAYPPLAELGLRFEEMANPRWFREDPELAWGFYGHRHELYLKARPHRGYDILLDWESRYGISSFVYTSNVDGHFSRAGWKEERILECHGSLFRLQCMESCGQPIWETEADGPPIVEVCETNLRAFPPLPRCPLCGSLARPNLLMFSDFEWDASVKLAQERRMRQWFYDHADEDLTILEFGAGLSVPTVRLFCEATRRRYGCRMARINPRDCTPDEFIEGLPFGALECLEAINETLLE